MAKMVDLVEKKIISSIRKIKNEDISPWESGIARMFVRMKDLDEALYEELMVRYKKVLNR